MEEEKVSIRRERLGIGWWKDIEGYARCLFYFFLEYIRKVDKLRERNGEEEEERS